jgi:large subunit ribosomal protein L21
MPTLLEKQGAGKRRGFPACFRPTHFFVDIISESSNIYRFLRYHFFAGGLRMYAVVNTGGKQYRVEKGETLRIEKIPGEVGSQVTFDKVLMVADGKTIRVGQPLLEKALVQASIVEQDKAKKIIVFKYKRRKRYRRKQGHRQPYTAIRIDGIEA